MRYLNPCIAALAATTSSAFAPHHARSAHLLAAVATRGGGDADPALPSASPDDVSPPAAASASNDNQSELETLLERARHCLSSKDAEGAFATLAQAYGIDPTSPKVSALFESCLSLKVELAEKNYYEWKDRFDATGVGDDCTNISERELNGLFQDRMGLSSLYIDRELYDEAGVQLRKSIEEATFWLNGSLQQTNGADGDALEDFSATKFQHWQPQIDRARYLLYRTNAACCHWDTYFEDGDRLRQSMLHASSRGEGTRLLHPFDALKFPCVSLELASDIARSYASRALETVGATADASKKSNQYVPRRRVVASRPDEKRPARKLRIGYISPDFTSKHPLSFLMQHVFRCHDKSRFVVNIYSVSSSAKDDGPEVRAIRESSDQFTYLSPSSMSPAEMYRRILEDELDILVDLCGYAGTSIVSEIMATRSLLRADPNYVQSTASSTRQFPFHVSYMGFPGSVGSSRVWDYSVFDPIVVPPDEEQGIRQHYDEALVYMPHCYFINSHKTVVGGKEDGILLADENEKRAKRSEYGIPHSSFVYCCHSRPDKIDAATFKAWMRAIMRLRSSTHDKQVVLWLLRSGDEMEQNLRQWVRQEFGNEAESCLVFADVADRREHLRRLGVADVFLDTPAYNAHTLGCDALYMGVPMISLLRQTEQNGDVALGLDSSADSDAHLDHDFEVRSVATDKLASRVGASLLRAIGSEGLDDLVCPDMDNYEDMMAKCCEDAMWFNEIRQRLLSTKDTSPLFDTERWVRNLESAFSTMSELGASCDLPDIFVSEAEGLDGG